MTCDDKNNPSSEGFPPKRDLKRPLDSNEDQLSEKRLKTLITDSSNLKDTSDLVHENNENDTKVTNKTRNVVQKHSRRKKKKLEMVNPVLKRNEEASLQTESAYNAWKRWLMPRLASCFLVSLCSLLC